MIPLDTVEPATPIIPPGIPKFHVIVEFGTGIPSDAQSVVLFGMEKSLREMGIPAEVFKPTKADDSKLRRNMTQEQRERL